VELIGFFKGSHRTGKYCPAHCNQYDYIYSNVDAHPHPDTHLDEYGDLDEDEHSDHADLDKDHHPDSHGDEYTDRYRHAYGDCDTDASSDLYANDYTDKYLNKYANMDGDHHSDAYRDGNIDGLAHGDSSSPSGHGKDQRRICAHVFLDLDRRS
jgi:hypothetical protein